MRCLGLSGAAGVNVSEVSMKRSSNEMRKAVLRGKKDQKKQKKDGEHWRAARQIHVVFPFQ